MNVKMLSPDRRAARDRYLDAARDSIVAFGWRRTTLTEIARRAGVSRMTIYRTWSDTQKLLGDLLTREWADVVEQNFVPEGNLREVAVAGLVKTVRAMRHNPLYQRVLELDPELVLPYLFTRRGRVQEHNLEVLRRVVQEGQARGEVRAGSPDTLARVLMMTTQGFVLSARIWIDDTTDESAIDAELALLLDRVLRP